MITRISSQIIPKNIQKPNSNATKSSPVSFGYRVEVYDFDALEESLLEVNDTVCPACGTKMIAKSKFRPIMIQAQQVQSAEDMYNFLDKYREYIPVEYRKQLLKDVRKIKNNSATLPVAFVLKDLRKYAVSNLYDSAHKLQTMLLEAAEIPDIPEDKVMAFENAAYIVTRMMKENKFTSPSFRFPRFADELESALDLDLPEEHMQVADDIRKLYISKMAHQFKERGLFDFSDNLPTIPDLLVYKMLAVSKPHIGRFYDGKEMIPLCTKCIVHTHKPFSFTPNIKDSQKDNFKQFINDVATGIIAGTNTVFFKYPQQLIGLISNATKGAIGMTRRSLPPEFREFVFKAQKVEFEPTLFDNVPCANCGMETYTHEYKSSLMAQIQNAETPKDLAKIIEANKTHVHKLYSLFTNGVLNATSINEDVSWSDMLKQLDRSVRSDFNTNMNSVAKRLNGLKKLTESTYDYNELQKILKAVQTIQRRGDASVENFYAIESLYKFQDPKLTYSVHGILHSPEIWSALTRNIHYKFSVNDDVTDEVKVKRIIKNLYGFSIATVDHLEAKDLGGEDEQDNLVVMCKECNTQKSNRYLHSWKKYNPQMRDNLAKYLIFIEKLRSEGKLKGFDDYTLNVINRFDNCQPPRKD